METLPRFSPLAPNIGVQASGVDLSKPLGDAQRNAIQQAVYKHGLVLFKNVELAEDEQIRLAKQFGRISKLGAFFKKMPDAIYVSNEREDGILGDYELGFHADKFYWQYPLKGAMLYAMEVPNIGGETIFANTAHVANTMEADLKQRLSGLTVRHEFSYRVSYGSDTALVSATKLEESELDKIERCDHPVIARHPWSDADYITINTRSAKRVLGMSEQESRELLDKVNALIDQPQNVYRHTWQKGDLIFWDNYILQHARTPFSSTEKRTLRRCQIAHELEPA